MGSSRFWSDLHHELISAIRAGIRPQLGQAFIARLEERGYVLDATVRPSVAILRRASAGPSGGTAILETERATATIDALIHARAFPESVREAYIEIVSVNEPGRVVTTIELLSPANKRPGAGREVYLREQHDVLQSRTHLLEIHLLRGGKHAVAAPIGDILAQQEHWGYLCCLHRAGRGSEYDVWPWSVRSALPRVSVPLTPDYGDIELDLQAALGSACEAGGYAESLTYGRDPDPPLRAEDAAWADGQLRELGLRA